MNPTAPFRYTPEVTDHAPNAKPDSSPAGKLSYEQLQAAYDALDLDAHRQNQEIQELTGCLQDERRSRTQLEEALRDSESHTRAIFGNSPDAIFIEDMEGTVLDANPEACRLHGCQRHDLVGKNVLDLVPASSYEQVKHDFPRLVSGEVDTYEGMSRRSDGEDIPIEIRARKIDLGGRQALLLHVRDISARLESEKALRRSEEQLRQSQKMEALGRLAGGVAHDFNNVLTSILGFSNLILEQIAAHDPIREDIEEIIRAGERAADLTRQLLAFGRKQTVRMRIIDLNDVVQDCEKLLRRTLGEDVQLVTKLSDTQATINGDPGQLEQVITNLSINARDAMEQGGRLTLSTYATSVPAEHAALHPEGRPGAYVVLSVRDNGVGMSDDIRQHVFEPFFTTKQPTKGTGLGLSTVYGIVQQSEACIDLRSSEGRGTEFLIYFPAPDASEASPAIAVERLEIPRGSETILVVEDEATVLYLTVRLLESLGYQVLEAANAHGALELARARDEAIDLVISDVVMPGLNGPEMIGKMREFRHDFRVLFMTGFTEDNLVDPDSPTAPPAVILKPFTRTALAVQVRTVLDQSVPR